MARRLNMEGEKRETRDISQEMGNYLHRVGQYADPDVIPDFLMEVYEDGCTDEITAS